MIALPRLPALPVLAVLAALAARRARRAEVRAARALDARLARMAPHLLDDIGIGSGTRAPRAPEPCRSCAARSGRPPLWP